MPTLPVTTFEILVYTLTIILFFPNAIINCYTESIHYSMYSSLVALASLGYTKGVVGYKTIGTLTRKS